MSEGFTATHTVPEDGLPAWADPDPNAAPVAQLDPGLEAQVLDQRPDGWAHVGFSNGWTAWIDGRKLVALDASPVDVPAAGAPAAEESPAEAPATDAQPVVAGPGPWAPTHEIPAAGSPAWTTPDPAQAPVATLDAGLPVQVLEQRADGWAQVRCSNDWTAWVDGRGLARPGTSRAVAEDEDDEGWRGIIVPLLGAAVVIAAGFLPWTGVSGVGFSAWDLPIGLLTSSTPSASDIRVAWPLFVVLVLALPLLTRRPLPVPARIAIAAVPALIAVDVLIRLIDLGADVGAGEFAAVFGAAMIAKPQG